MTASISFFNGSRGGVAVFNSINSVISSTTLTLTATSTRDLSAAWFGAELGNTSVQASWTAQSVAGAAASQSITIDLLALFGFAQTDTLYGRLYYNTDPLDDPGTRVYTAFPTTIGLESDTGQILLENGVDKWLVEAGIGLDLSSYATVTPTLSDSIVFYDASGGVLATMLVSDLKTFVSA